MSSLHEFIGSVKDVVEARPVFRAASSKEVAKRPKPPVEVAFHVYSADRDDSDRWVTDYSEAEQHAEKMVKDGFRNVRIWRLEHDVNDDDNDDEQCIWVSDDEDDIGEAKQVFRAASPEDLINRASAEDKKLETLRQAIKFCDTALVQDAASKAVFDDVQSSTAEEVLDDWHSSFWTQVCDHHVWQYGLPRNSLSPGAGICGVLGCKRESDHYYDFETAETLKAKETA